MLLGCRRPEEINRETPPTTRLFIHKIGVDTLVNRLPSSVRLQWTGTTSSGYVTGFKVYWGFEPLADPASHFLGISEVTTKTDSTFLFRLNPDAPFTSIYFYVQAIANTGLPDPQPAFLEIPIRNTPPVAIWTAEAKPRSLEQLLCLTFGAEVSDVDGFETVSKVEIKINEGPWTEVPRTIDLVSFMPTNPNTILPDVQPARYYLGFIPALQPNQITGYVLNDSNYFYIRAIDLAGDTSRIDTAGPYIPLGKTANTLIVDSYNIPGQAPWDVYKPILDNIHPNYDYHNLLANGGGRQPRQWNNTFLLAVSEYDKVFWFNDFNKVTNLADPTQLMIESAAPPLRQFLIDGGKLMMTTAISNGSGRPLESSPLYTYLPISIDSAPPFVDAFLRLFNGGQVTDPNPVNPYPTLTVGPGFIGGANPFRPTNDSRPVYRANLTNQAGQPYFPNTFAAVRFNQNRPNLFFSTLELHRARNNPQALEDLFNRVLNQDFNW